MKDSIIKWIVWLLVAVVISVAASWALLGHSTGKMVGAITSPPTVLDFLQLTQGLGFGTLGTTPVTISGSRVAFSGTSQIACSIANPYNATSTLNNFAINILVATSSTNTLVVGTSTTATGTSTTPLITSTVGSGLTQVLSFDGGTNTNIIGPGQFVTVGYTNASLSTGVNIGGVCSATFQSTN